MQQNEVKKTHSMRTLEEIEKVRSPTAQKRAQTDTEFLKIAGALAVGNKLHGATTHAPRPPLNLASTKARETERVTEPEKKGESEWGGQTDRETQRAGRGGRRGALTEKNWGVRFGPLTRNSGKSPAALTEKKSLLKYFGNNCWGGGVSLWNEVALNRRKLHFRYSFVILNIEVVELFSGKSQFSRRRGYCWNCFHHNCWSVISRFAPLLKGVELRGAKWQMGWRRVGLARVYDDVLPVASHALLRTSSFWPPCLLFGFSKPVVWGTPDSRGFRHFVVSVISAAPALNHLICGCLSCVHRCRRFRDSHLFCTEATLCKP